MSSDYPEVPHRANLPMPKILHDYYCALYSCQPEEVNQELANNQAQWEQCFSLDDVECIGFTAYTRDTDLRYCHSPLCPGCWHRQMIGQLHAIGAAKARGDGTLFIRRTNGIHPSPTPPEGLIAQMRRQHQPSRLVFLAPLLRFEYDDEEEPDNIGVLTYTLLSLVHGPRIPREYPRGNIVIEELPGDPMTYWLDNNEHPSEFFSHGGIFDAYVALRALSEKYPGLWRVGRGFKEGRRRSPYLKAEADTPVEPGSL